MRHRSEDGHHRRGHLCDTNDRNVLVAEIRSSKDATLFQDLDRIAASRDRFVVGRTPNGLRRALLWFDVSRIDSGSVGLSSKGTSTTKFPKDVQVVCAEIGLTVVEDESSTFDAHDRNRIVLYPVLNEWTTSEAKEENGLQGYNGGVAAQNDATWKYSSYPSSTWDTPGGDFLAERGLSRETLINAEDNGATSYPFRHWFGSTPGTQRVVQGWVTGRESVTSGNFGFLLKLAEEGDSGSDDDYFQIYHGIENDPDTVPRLIITYTAPSLGYAHQEHRRHGIQKDGMKDGVLYAFAATGVIITLLVTAWVWKRRRSNNSNFANHHKSKATPNKNNEGQEGTESSAADTSFELQDLELEVEKGQFS